VKSFFISLLIILSTTISAELSPKALKKLVIISCSGKSGSCTLEASFKKLGFETIRRHGLSSALIQQIQKRSNDTDVLIIDSVRDVIARKISSYFQNITDHLKLTKEQILKRYNREGVQFLLKDFDRRFIHLEQYYTFSHWKALGYNCITDQEFNFEKRHQLKRLGNIYFVNLRFDDINEWEKIIRSLNIPFNLSAFTIEPRNLAQEKWYSQIYRDFLHHFTFTQKSFDTVLDKNHDVLIHFYKHEELEQFFDKWTPYIR